MSARSTEAHWDAWLSMFANRNEVADEYARWLAYCLLDDVQPDFAEFNHAILRRWSMSGMQYIKARAWKIRAAASPSGTDTPDA